MRGLLIVLGAVFALALPSVALGSPSLRAGIQDDAWLEYGPGTLEDRLDRLDALGVDVVRVTVNWRAAEPRRGAADWERTDALLDGLHAHGIAPLVTLWGTPGWANSGKAVNVAPTSGATFASFARRIAQRYPYVRMWTIWNEPNQRRWLLPTSPAVYTQRLLNPAYAAIHAVSPRSQVAGGVTAPRASAGGVSPVAWIDGMRAAHARLDAYAHNPYPLRPGETPSAGGCGHCTTITMATLPRLLDRVARDFGTRTRIWLTEYGYQTNPPDRSLGVSYAAQARFVSEAALRAYLAPRVDVLVHYLLRDEPDAARWQSGLLSVRDAAKPSYNAFRSPLTVRSRTGLRTVLWGQIRPGGSATYRLLRFANGRWNRVGADRRTTGRGILGVAVRAKPGDRFRLWLPAQHTYSAILTVR